MLLRSCSQLVSWSLTSLLSDLACASILNMTIVDEWGKILYLSKKTEAILKTSKNMEGILKLTTLIRSLIWILLQSKPPRCLKDWLNKTDQQSENRSQKRQTVKCSGVKEVSLS